MMRPIRHKLKRQRKVNNMGRYINPPPTPKTTEHKDEPIPIRFIDLNAKRTPNDLDDRIEDLKVAVIVHIYYPEIWPELLSYIRKIPVPYDVFVSIVEGVSCPDLMKDVPQENITIVENRGYDIGGMVEVLRTLDLSKYKYACKIHTKMSKHQEGGDRWRKELLNGILGDPLKIKKILYEFETTNVGMVGAKGRVQRINHGVGDHNAKHLSSLFSMLDISKDAYDEPFVGGTMFWIKRELLSVVQSLNLPKDYFEEFKFLTDKMRMSGKDHDGKTLFDGALYHNTNKMPCDGLKSHAFERVFGPLVNKMGYFTLGI